MGSRDRVDGARAWRGLAAFGVAVILGACGGGNDSDDAGSTRVQDSAGRSSTGETAEALDTTTSGADTDADAAAPRSDVAAPGDSSTSTAVPSSEAVPSTVPAPAATTAPAPAPPTGGTGSEPAPPGVVTVASTPSTFTAASPGDPAFIGSASDCFSVTVDGFDLIDCGAAPGASPPLVWWVGASPQTDLRVLLILSERVPGSLSTDLVRIERSVNEWARASAVAMDLDADGAEELLVGVRLDGPTSLLDVEIVDAIDGRASVVAARAGLADGGAKGYVGSVEIRAAVFAGDDPECCPSNEHDEVWSPSTAGWFVLAEAIVPSGSGFDWGSDV